MLIFRTWSTNTFGNDSGGWPGTSTPTSTNPADSLSISSVGANPATSQGDHWGGPPPFEPGKPWKVIYTHSLNLVSNFPFSNCQFL